MHVERKQKRDHTIEPSKPPWVCWVVIAKKKRRIHWDFVVTFDIWVPSRWRMPTLYWEKMKAFQIWGMQIFSQLLIWGRLFDKYHLGNKTGTERGCKLGWFQWKKVSFGLCNATATFQRLLGKAPLGVTKKLGSLVMCFVGDVVIATPRLEDQNERVD